MMSARGGAASALDVSVTDSPLANFESLTQAAIIAVMGIAIVISNLLIIASFLNFKGTYSLYWLYVFIVRFYHVIAIRPCKTRVMYHS